MIPIFTEAGYAEVWKAQSSEVAQFYVPNILNSIKELRHQNDIHRIENSSHFSWYRQLNYQLTNKEYLCMNLPISYIRLFARLRINKSIFIKGGKITPSCAACSFCNLDDIEDWYHILFTCPVYSF
jgi:hypothetical protein